MLKETSKTFEANSKDVEDDILDPDVVDWVTFAPKRKCLQLEDARAKSERLRLGGVTLAEAERLQILFIFCLFVIILSFSKKIQDICSLWELF